ncbi:MAG: hypothetical protein J6N76_01700 [Lachnospiraceae bacterium]|nr:hypothetical protein [Lachnospiraceae bacterium]
MGEFRIMLQNVERSYEGFVHAVISYIKTPGNEYKKDMIEKYILDNPTVNSSDVLEYMINETGFFEKTDSPDLEVVA